MKRAWRILLIGGACGALAGITTSAPLLPLPDAVRGLFVQSHAFMIACVVLSCPAQWIVEFWSDNLGRPPHSEAGGWLAIAIVNIVFWTALGMMAAGLLHFLGGAKKRR